MVPSGNCRDRTSGKQFGFRTTSYSTWTQIQLASEKIQFAQAVECHVWKLAQCELRVSSRKLRHVRRTCSVPFFFDLHVYSHIQYSIQFTKLVNFLFSERRTLANDHISSTVRYSCSHMSVKRCLLTVFVAARWALVYAVVLCLLRLPYPASIAHQSGTPQALTSAQGLSYARPREARAKSLYILHARFCRWTLDIFCKSVLVRTYAAYLCYVALCTRYWESFDAMVIRCTTWIVA